MVVIKRKRRTLMLALCFCHLLFQVTTAAVCTNKDISVDGRSPIGTLVGDLGCTGTNLTIISGDTNNMFSVDSQGNLTTMRFLYESMDYMYELTLDVDGEYNVIQVKVTYVNTAKPVLLNLPDVLEIDENTPTGTQIYTFSFSDADKATGGLGGQAYVDFVRPGAAAAKKWLIDRASGAFYVNTVFDTTTKSVYKIGLKAYDMHPSSPKTSDKQVLTILLKESNNHSPECSSYSKLIRVKENVDVGTVMDTLTCTDDDTGLNGQLSYRLSESNSPDVKNTFKFVSNGLKLQSTLDYETTTIYKILAEVYDGGPLQKTTTVHITIVVKGVDIITTLYGSKYSIVNTTWFT